MFDNLSGTVRGAATDVAWTQWSALGAQVTAARTARSIVDPEALVILTLLLREDERRLWDVLGWWAARGSHLLSVQRIKNLVDDYPAGASERLGEFARLAKSEGSDARWGRLASAVPGPEVRPSKARAGEPTVVTPAALLLRLRLGLGVGVKADLLGLLLGLEGDTATVRELAEATVYTRRSVKRAADEMADARLIEASRGAPATYRLVLAPWTELLDLPEPAPRWRHWHPVFALVTHLLAWTEQVASEEPGRHVASSRARSLMEAHRAAFERNRISIPEPEDHPGTEYLAAFRETVETLCGWMGEKA